MIRWKCNEQKEGWHITAVLPMGRGVEIKTDVLIKRKLMSPTSMTDCIVEMTRAMNWARANHEESMYD